MEVVSTIWDRIANGDKGAYAELFRDMYKRLYNYGNKFTDDKNIVEDTVQETLMVIWYKRVELRKVKYPETYSFSIFRNTLFTRLKSHQRFIMGDITEGEPEFGMDQIIVNREVDAQTRKRIESAIAALTSRQREAIFLRFYEGLPYDQIAQMLGITTKATYKIMARALEELRHTLQISNTLLLIILSDLTSRKYF